ncbi:GPI-anchor transamidase [Coprinopsis cinerea AmutBmut pab1-1]|nr:GPI-anchor transamidase [Coprinopsis cinerea AmutBmut pab1-1]
MDSTQRPPTQGLLARIKQRFQSSGNPSESRIRRRQAVIQKLTKRVPYIRILLLIIGYLWVLALPLPELAKGVYMDENALSPGHVKPRLGWAEVHSADRWLEQLERLRDDNATSEQRAQYIVDEFTKLGLSGATQKYKFTMANETITGVNAYAVSSSPRISGTEAMVISASWLSRRGEGNGDLNLRGVATVLALAKYLKSYSSWSKDLVFVIGDGYLDGMQAWLNGYHNADQKNLEAEPLQYPSGVIWTALSIDYACHSFSHLGVFHEGVNGRLPNQDLINGFERLARWTVGSPVVMYDHAEVPPAPSWIPQIVQKHPRFEVYWQRALNVLRHFGYQARGRPSGIHGLFHRHRIDAFTIYANCATGPHGFYAMGRIVEATLRTMNNLLERLHASFFFYILTGSYTFLKIGSFIPSAILIGVSMLFQGLTSWVNAGWVLVDKGSSEKEANSKPIWRRRNRQVLLVVLTMIFTHVLGAALFGILSTPWFIQNIATVSIPLLAAFSIAPIVVLALAPQPSQDDAPISLTLKALNLCLASAVISVTSMLNFSLALSFAILQGVPLSLSAFSRTPVARFAGYASYCVLALGWLAVFPDEVKNAIWHWEIASVWFAPVVCIVYVPLVLQAGIATLLSH